MRSVINIDELQCTKLLSSLYPSEFDLVRTEMVQWVQNHDKISSSIMAAKFLWLCRINKIPAMFSEISKNFGVRPKNIMQVEIVIIGIE